MPSLRRSLILYFLALVGLALGGLGLLIDRFAAYALDARLKSETDRINQETTAEVEKTRGKFDADLLVEARQLAREYRARLMGLVRVNYSRAGEESLRMFNLAMQLMPLGDAGNGWATATAGVFSHGSPNPFDRGRQQLFGAYHTNVLREPYDAARAEFQASPEHTHLFQLHVAARDTRDRQVLRHSGLPEELPTDLPNEDATDTWYDDVAVPGLGTVRRLMYRSPYYAPIPPRQTFPIGGRGGRPGSSPGGFAPIVVQVAHPLADKEEVLSRLTQRRDEQFTTLAAETGDAQHRLRLRIATIGGITFLAVVFGGWLLIGVGLSPLRKLSDAVSQVTEKDFRLSVEKEELTTELAPIHDRLTQSLDALRRAFEREKAAVADISHELRTPVAGMLATMDVALRKPRTAEQYKETLAECRTIAKQLGGLVERVMTLAYLDAGHNSAHPIPVDVSELAGGCAAVIRPLATAHGLTLRTDLPPAAEFTTDPDRLREVLMNLLHNAIEYNKPGGSITLKAERDPAGLTVEVADTGIGMSDDVKAKIFDRFFRADPSRTATGAHAGLGLAIVKEAVNRLGGSIAVDSTPADGSTFRVRLPG